MDKKAMVERIIRNAYAMSKSRTNVVVFKDDPWLWFQYYLGLVFDRPTFIIMDKTKYKGLSFVAIFESNPLVKKILWVDDYSNKTVEIAANEIAQFVEDQKEY